MSSVTERAIDGVVDHVEADGFAIIPDVLAPGEVHDVLERLWAASSESERRGVSAHVQGLDPARERVDGHPL